MSEKYKSRKNEPVYSSTYDNGGWPNRDSLPTKDPIGDVDEKDNLKCDFTGKYIGEKPDEWVEGYKRWKKDQENYEKTMKNKLLRPEGKININNLKIKQEIKCTCGTQAVYGKVPVEAHSHNCDLFKAMKNELV